MSTFKYELKLPIASMEPCNGRLYAVEVTPRVDVTPSGIITTTDVIPGVKQGPTGKPAAEIRRKRYIAISVSKDLTIGRSLGSKEKSPIRRGTEIFPHLPNEIEAFTFPDVIDWANAGAKYKVFHESELIGFDNLVNDEMERAWRRQIIPSLIKRIFKKK